MWRLQTWHCHHPEMNQGRNNDKAVEGQGGWRQAKLSTRTNCCCHRDAASIAK